jgi:hypothetical protein
MLPVRFVTALPLPVRRRRPPAGTPLRRPRRAERPDAAATPSVETKNPQFGFVRQHPSLRRHPARAGREAGDFRITYLATRHQPAPWAGLGAETVLGPERTCGPSKQIRRFYGAAAPAIL